MGVGTGEGVADGRSMRGKGTSIGPSTGPSRGVPVSWGAQAETSESRPNLRNVRRERGLFIIILYHKCGRLATGDSNQPSAVSRWPQAVPPIEKPFRYQTNQECAQSLPEAETGGEKAESARMPEVGCVTYGRRVRRLVRFSMRPADRKRSSRCGGFGLVGCCR